jgi:hypothetical protein
MSIDFAVDVADHKIELTDLRDETEVALRELLHLSFTPKLTIESGIGEFEDVTDFELPDQGRATLSYLHLPHVDLPPEDEDVFAGIRRIASINGSGWRTEASIALALALGIALARRVGKSLIDDALLFSSEISIAPDRLLAQVRLKSVHCDLEAAARELLSEFRARWRARSTV